MLGVLCSIVNIDIVWQLNIPNITNWTSWTSWTLPTGLPWPSHEDRLGWTVSCVLELSCHRTLVHTISYAGVGFWRVSNLVNDLLNAIYWFQRVCYILCYLLFGCRQNYLHVAYSHLPIVLKYRTDMLHSGYLGFGGVNLEHLPATTCIYSQNVSTANKYWIWGGLWLNWCIFVKL